MTFDEVDDATFQLKRQILAGTTAVEARKLGLDERCGVLYVGPDFIAKDSARNLDYYGGFEYVTAEYYRIVGNLKIYSTENDRVRGHHERFRDIQEDQKC